MFINNQTKMLLIVGAILILIYFIYSSSQTSPVKNKGDVEIDANEIQFTLPTNIEKKAADLDKPVLLPREDHMRAFPYMGYAAHINDKGYMPTIRNKSRSGHKKSSYIGGIRGHFGKSNWSDQFDHNNNIIGASQTGDNDKFLPIDESNGRLAIFKSRGRATCGSNQHCEPEDLFDVDKYLPQEVNDDWWEVQKEPISVKNRHLINIAKPIGINTIGTSLRNASYDIRGAPSVPKTVVSPWLNSAIEPDVNIKPLY